MREAMATPRLVKEMPMSPMNRSARMRPLMVGTFTPRKMLAASMSRACSDAVVVPQAGQDDESAAVQGIAGHEGRSPVMKD